MATAKKQTRSRPETIARRREILRAATDIFGSKGSVNGTLTDIADQVGMTHAGILHHFGSKDLLLMEVLTYRDESDVDHLEEKHIPTGIEFFRHLVRTAFSNAQRAGLVQLYAVLSAESVTDDHAARDYFVDRYRNLRQEAIESFELLCAQREVEAPDTVAHAAAAILAVMDGLQIQWLLDPENLLLGEASEFAIEAIVSAVVNPQPSPLREPALETSAE
ncbi:TetR/AcrR family transcriptional regulator [Mycetocola tolaasinivorans]|uniref:TetR/AcrR family transcriptional regulator n=1 Tax=Mycetocola tolaasinivorans TaxID=76635 RepID=A0A3L7ACT8_9MICO|nr:TetR/AcrR family transcriptional regulator [Mycetocola tolaasinivorans]RLP77471.1 TetR/AcrR family transcriptional regulator [Mycetocola tolaasinivorans]